MSLATLVLEAEPECCGEPMIHNSYSGQYECADAYFYLDGDGLLGDIGDLIEWRRPLTKFDRERHAHWKASFMADGWDR